MTEKEQQYPVSQHLGLLFRHDQRCFLTLFNTEGSELTPLYPLTKTEDDGDTLHDNPDTMVFMLVNVTERPMPQGGPLFNMSSMGELDLRSMQYDKGAMKFYEEIYLDRYALMPLFSSLVSMVKLSQKFEIPPELIVCH